MLANWTHKKKFCFLLMALSIMIWVAFRFGFNRTFEVKEQLNQTSTALAGIQDAPARLAHIKSEIERIENLMGDVSGEETSPYLIEKIGTYCKKNQLTLVEIPLKHLFANVDFVIATHKIVIEGPYKKLLELLYELETNSLAGKIRSVSFESQYNLKKKCKELHVTYYIQSVGLLNE